ncbi:FliM/FliN family flagellar motor switch protein [Psychromarinibacter sp. C21-152]|uniref:FliM/FliN family flagellar motor switch protein n=1 Tax=Psychromarinibacter sediminicola TaxID=3033385 RepID=A0AAE3T7E8_9RHOB|nr:FliM/FliN family flagellar motor switch protein [Psychromarinibacter sediminicola]MDF0599588.1 FliM/FliN family flagellar motor switch protein [Psychromarinibacter sediminicola]
MGDDKDIPVLRRKAAARRAALGLAEMTPTKAMRLALAKAGDAALCVPVALRGMTEGSLSPDGLADALPERALTLRLDGPGGAVALAVLCPQAVAAATEAQTMGRVLKAPAAERRPTGTDALLVRDFVEQILAAFAALAADCRGLPPIDGYGFAGRIPEARVAAMAIQDAPHLHLTVDMTFASDAKEGSLHLILPTRVPARPDPPAAETDWSAAMEKAVLASAVRLEGVLCRIRLPLAEITTLEAGQVVPLGRATLDGVELRAVDGRRIITARLGRSGAMRAVRLHVGGDDAASGGAGPQAALAPETPTDTPPDDAPAADAPAASAPPPAPMAEPAFPEAPADLDPMPMAAPLDLPE